MSVGVALAVAAGGMVGAPCRYLLDRAVSGRVESDLPWGTLAVNVSGSLLLGLLSGIGLSHHLPAPIEALLGTGLCGAYTTFSTFGYETATLLEDGQLLEALANVAGNLAVGVAAAAAGVAAGLAL